MCYGEIGIFKGFIVKGDVRVPLIEINGEVREIMIPISQNVKIGDKVMVYNSYNFDYEFNYINIEALKLALSMIQNVKSLLIH
ncbi:hypothetical protein Metvu_1087 [Methanocaldococcus vulcanius M7]|uniref:Uncharacterized protein n=1 Tax=Methanocaldococcus vulcanius (strain ATCC 700851 / DSM 12094 / M7) TaxID=579137 RepID=C9RH93_METVM|nr:hypothetical protein [Methanocaldococcus vulcanius]ACX72945.1 hypothetical protein Metvu_1087 [Methanocaldococcus vulcanius M7]